jgi:hypothetical protein
MMLAWIANAGAVWLVVSAALSMVRQRRKTKARQRTRDLVVSPLAGLAMGAMFLGLQEIVQPQARHMIVEELKEERMEDEAAEPLGGRLFYQQMRRIRMGDEVEEVTVRVEGGTV